MSRPLTSFALSKRLSGQDLDASFKAWLLTEGKPALS
jgi:hypothetical protein